MLLKTQLKILKQKSMNWNLLEMKGKLVRSRAKWVDEGEKPTKYFCGLESKNYTSKIIPKVEKDNEEIVTDQKEILKEVQYLYEICTKINMKI